jgi:hypothetical protein
VALIISTAAGTVIASDSPFMLITAVSHWPRLLAPSDSGGLNWRVRLPIPARLKTIPSLVLQARQFQIRFSAELSRSSPPM